MSSAVLYRGRKVTLEIRRLHLPDGRVVERECVVHPGAVAIVPFVDPETVCLIRNHRFAVGRELYEVPAGTLEPGEPPAACAARELEEETGYRAGRLEPLCRFYSSPGVLTELMHVFVAHDLEQVGQRLEPGEQVQLAPTPWAEALAMVRDGRIVDGKTVAALLYCHAFAGSKWR